MGRDSFSKRLIAWQKHSGRHDLPWQNTKDPYRIWVSEIMLQQTQATTVIPFYLRFIERFPDMVSLGEADMDEVMAHWSGLGYYARARNLHKAAQIVLAQGLQQLPIDPNELEKLPGIGRSTAAAIAAFATGERVAILDGNVKRVLTRHFAIEGFPGKKAVENTLWQLAESLLPESNMEAYTQGLMDLGATLCRRSKPECSRCPLRDSCLSFIQDCVHAYPQPRPKKTRVERYEKAWLIHRTRPLSTPLESSDQFLLEQRPPSGIWGGLWCLPEKISLELEKSLRIEVEPQQIEHNFTHFKLYLSVQQAKLERESPAIEPLKVAESNQVLQWFSIKKALSLGLPAPVRQLLQALKKH